MRQSYLLVCSTLLLSCAPGKPFKPFQPPKSNKTNATAQPLGSDAIPSSDVQRTIPDDPEEEEKAIEPAIIGGAYLYCDADEAKPDADTQPPMLAGCRVGNVDDTEWVTADKNVLVMNMTDGSEAPSAITIPAPGSAYHIVFNADRSLQNDLELQVGVMLPQGLVQMSTTINPGSSKAIQQRLGKGLALYASTGSAGDWPGIDRKTWNLWMPLQIPRFITNFEPKASGSEQGPGGPGPQQGPDDKTQKVVELTFDDTVCTYKTKAADAPKPEIKGIKPEDFIFESCTRNWLPEQWVRSKSLSLQIVRDAKSQRTESVGVVLQTGP